MSLVNIENDLKTAMKEKNEVKLGTLRMLKAAVKNKEIDKKVTNFLSGKDPEDYRGKAIKI